jgi:ribosomal protein L22
MSDEPETPTPETAGAAPEPEAPGAPEPVADEPVAEEPDAEEPDADGSDDAGDDAEEPATEDELVPVEPPVIAPQAVVAPKATTPEGAGMAVATAKHVHCSARKARLLADLVRGKSVPEAQAILAFSPRAAALPVRKVLESAMANADHNHGMNATELTLARVLVDEGPTMRRFQPRAMGRASRIRKRTCHITIGLAPQGTPGGRR